MGNSSVSKYIDGQMRMRREEGAVPNKKIIIIIQKTQLKQMDLFLQKDFISSAIFQLRSREKKSLELENIAQLINSLNGS